MLSTGEAIHSDEVPGTFGTEVASDEEGYRPDPLLEGWSLTGVQRNVRQDGLRWRTESCNP